MPKQKTKTTKPIPLHTTLCPDCHRLIYAHINIDGTITHKIANHFITRDQTETFHTARFTLYQLHPDAGIIQTITPTDPLPNKRGSPRIWWLNHLCAWDTTPKRDGIPLIVFTYPPKIPGLTKTQAQQVIDYLNRPPY